METGVLSHENLASILRNISQRRRQGILEVGSKASSVQIFFAQGKVLDARKTDTPVARDFIDRLVRSKRLNSAEGINDATYEAMQKSLLSIGENEIASKEFIVWANQERVLDILYALDTETSSYYTFKAQMVEVEKDFAASISVGQVLLDLVALQSDQPEFDAIFSKGSVVEVLQIPDNCSIEEKEILSALTEPLSVEEVGDKVMLSGYHFQSAMLSLKQRGALKLQNQIAGKANVDAISSDTFLQAFEDSIDMAFEAEKAISEAGIKIGAPNQEAPIASKNPQRPAKSDQQPWLTRANNQLLNSVWVPRILAWFLIVSAALSPFISWQRIWGWF